MRPVNHLAANLAYSLSFAQGTGSVSQQRSQHARGRRARAPKQTSPLDFDQRHKIAANLDWRFGKSEGPAWGGAHWLENFGVNLLMNIASGTPYTPRSSTTRSRSRPSVDRWPDPQNSRYGPWTVNLDLKATEGFSLAGFPMEASVWVLNLLGYDNPVEVYTSSGSASSVGFLSTQDGQAFTQTAAAQGSTAPGSTASRENDPTLFLESTSREVRPEDELLTATVDRREAYDETRAVTYWRWRCSPPPSSAPRRWGGSPACPQARTPSAQGAVREARAHARFGPAHRREHAQHVGDELRSRSPSISPPGTRGSSTRRERRRAAVFASGLWMGALVNGEPRLAIAEYGQEYSPGVMLDDSTFDDSALPRVHPVQEVVRYTGNAQDTAHVERSAEETAADPLLDPLLHHSWSEYLNGAAPYGAPTRLWHMPVTDTPQEGDSVFVLGPDVSGDQMIWSVYNDLDPSTRGATDAGNTDPMGVEVQQSTFGFEAQGALGNTLFLKFLIINKGENNLLNMFVSLWADPDLGGFTDDLVGVDTTLSLGYCYNATNNDRALRPDAAGRGLRLLPGPAVGNQFLGLRSFNKYINGTDPASATQTYNYMRGVNPDGSVLIDPTTGLPTTFFHPGDPVTKTGWLDANPNDRRFLLTTGPFDMAPGDTQTVVGAIVIGQGTDRLSSISGLRFFDQTAQLAFDLGFQLPPPPQQPTVTVTEDHGEINLCWDTASRFGPQAPGFTFEGYNVYQGETVAGPWKRIATFDEANKITTVYEPSF